MNRLLGYACNRTYLFERASPNPIDLHLVRLLLYLFLFDKSKDNFVQGQKDKMLTMRATTTCMLDEDFDFDAEDAADDEGDEEEAAAIQWAMAASIADCKQRGLQSERNESAEVRNKADMKRVRHNLFKASSNSGSASGAPLDDVDDSVHACSGSAEDERASKRTKQSQCLSVSSPTDAVNVLCSKSAVRMFSTLPPPSFAVHEGTPHKNILTVSSFTNSALHVSNSDNNSPLGSGVLGLLPFLLVLFLNRV